MYLSGSTLIIAPWNYPVYLVIVPLVGAIAAGCTAVVKPSEVTPHSAQVLTDLLHRYLDNKAYIVINGAVEETTLLLQQKWDHIFYTGNSAVAKIVMRAATEHLCSLTLELGGKSPAIIDENANMDVVARRLAFGKTYNTGQVRLQFMEWCPNYFLLLLPGWCHSAHLNQDLCLSLFLPFRPASPRTTPW
jgi:acyl-CoA reductase-like NAD-dependent aldehyde dehydrogenase